MWQLEGYSTPQYLNVSYGIPVDPPNGKHARHELWHVLT